MDTTTITTMKEFPTLTDLSSTGKTKEYYIWAESYSDGRACIRTKWGYSDSKMQEKSKIISVGKNIGKKNETTTYQQACKEALSTWKRKKDAGYSAVEDINSTEEPATTLPLPMLAHPYEKRKHNIKWPCMVQPKLDGMRILAGKDKSGSITFWTRNGKTVDTLDHLKEELNIYMQCGEIFDGEVYSHGMPLQEILSLAKDAKKDGTKLEYWVFDIMVEGVPNVERMKSLLVRGMALYEDQSTTSKVKLVTCHSMADEEHAKLQHDQYVVSGFEGLILRNYQGMYKLKYRSADLQKYKEFIDEEFQIVGGFEDADGGVVFTCITKDKKEFGVRPKGTVAVREQHLKDLEGYITDNKVLTVRYQNMSPDGIPIFPVGIVVRDYE